MSSFQIPIPEMLIDELASRLRELIAERQPAARWLTVLDAATHLGLSSNSIRALIKRGRIPFYKVEGRILLEQNELDRWVRSGGLSS